MNYNNFKKTLITAVQERLSLKDSDILRRDLSAYPVADEAYIIKGYVLYPNYLYYIFENNGEEEIMDTLIAQTVKGVEDKLSEDACNLCPVGDGSYKDMHVREDEEPEKISLLSEIKDRIIPVLIDTAENSHMFLQEASRGRYGMVTDRFAGMTVIYKVIPDTDGITAIPVTYDLMESMDIETASDLFFMALSNMKKMMPVQIRMMTDMYPQFIKNDDPLPLYVVTNKYGRYGAAGILQDLAALDFAKKHGNFYVMFSSVNEAIILSETDAKAHHVETEDMKDMLIDMNLILPSEEKVTDDLYYFDRRDCSWNIV